MGASEKGRVQIYRKPFRVTAKREPETCISPFYLLMVLRRIELTEQCCVNVKSQARFSLLHVIRQTIGVVRKQA